MTSIVSVTWVLTLFLQQVPFSNSWTPSSSIIIFRSPHRRSTATKPTFPLRPRLYPRQLNTLKLYLGDELEVFNRTVVTTSDDRSVNSGKSSPPKSSLSSLSSPAVSSASTLLLSRNNFGDIMSPSVDDEDLLFQDGLVTSSAQSLAQKYGIHHPLDRMAVTANGNLQRLVSSYYDAPVSVVVDHCRPISSKEWERKVQLQVFDQTFCVADSRVQVHSPDCQRLVESGQVGLGQLFRHLNVLPEFILHEAGPLEAEQEGGDGGFWRRYTLKCPQVTCCILERFIPNTWELQPRGINKK